MRYGYLAARRARLSLYELGGGVELGEDELEDWWAANVDRGAWASYVAAREAHLAAAKEFAAATRAESVPGARFVRATYPDGTSEAVGTDRTVASAAHLQYGRINPPPTRSSPSFQEWKSEQPSSEHRTWVCEWFADGQRSTPPQFARRPEHSYGLPIEALLGVLNDLAAQGWVVVSVSEDRGIYAGVDAPTDSGPTKIRYLLENPDPAPTR